MRCLSLCVKSVLVFSLVGVPVQVESAFPGEISNPWVFNLSAPLNPDSGYIQIEVQEDRSARMLYVRAQIEVHGLVAFLSGNRCQEYLSIMHAGATTGLVGLVHYQRVDVDRKGARINYGWSWNRNSGTVHVAARRFWGGTVVEFREFGTGDNVVLDLLSLFMRVFLLAAEAQSNPAPQHYVLFDPAGNISVAVSFVPAVASMADGVDIRCTKACIEFARRPVTFASKYLDLLISHDGRLLGGELSSARGLVPLRFVLQQ